MAKQSMIQREKKRERLIVKHKATREKAAYIQNIVIPDPHMAL